MASLSICIMQKRFMSSYPNLNASLSSQSNRKKVTLLSIKNMYSKNEPISVMTAHDYPSALYVEKSGIDICLVGDSLSMVALGYKDTNDITLDEMIHHSKAVARGIKSSFIVGDLPFGSYEASSELAIHSAIRFIKQGKVEAVKLEGGIEMAETISKITKIGIPVLGHIGLTPQRQTSLGGFRVQGKTIDSAKRLLQDAQALTDAGCFGIVVEAVPDQVAAFITKKISIPTIGIGAGLDCSGQVLVQMDALKVHDGHIPKFCNPFADVGELSVNALREYHLSVKNRKFPTFSYEMVKGEQDKLLEWIKSIDDGK